MIRKLNNKGMTAIEILVTFLIVAVIVVSLYDGIVALKDKETISSYKLSLVTYRDLLTKDIQDDLIKIGLAGAEVSPLSDNSGYKVTMTLRDGSKRILEVKQKFGCNAADSIEEDEVCVKAGIGVDTSDSFSISYGPIDDVVEYPLPDLGSEELPNLHGSGTHTIYSLRINEVDISTANQVFSLRVTLYHPDLGTKYSIDIVSPINYNSGNSSSTSYRLSTPVGTIRKNNSLGAIFPSGTWTTSDLWFGEFFTDSAIPIARYEYSKGCTGVVTGTLNPSGVIYTGTQNTSICIRAVDTENNISNWSSPYLFRIDKEKPTVNIIRPSVDNSNEIEAGTCYVKENGVGNQYNCFYKTVDVTGTAVDNYSGVETEKLTCTAVTNEGDSWDLKSTRISDSQIKVTANIPKNVLSIEKITCNFVVTDRVGNSNSTSTSFNMGNGWWQHPYNGGVGWYYFANGKQLTGWQYIYWYNNQISAEGRFDWYYFFDGTETAVKNGCYGPRYEMARGWCKEIGGYSGWYYFAINRQAVDNFRWVPDAAMLSDGTWIIDGSYYTFNSSGRCISGNGCY